MVDRVWLKILHGQLVNICDEVSYALMRTAYTPIFNEGLDLSALVLDRNGDLMATANINAAMLGQSLFSGRWVIDDIGVEAFEEGDIVVHNDPYRGGSHMPEHLLLAPFFLDGELSGFVGAIGHVAEIGGMAPGSFSSNATEIHQEGLRLPPVKLMEAGEPNKDVWRIMMANHRTPDTTWGDFRAMIGALNVGLRRIRALYEEHGRDTMAAAIPALYDYADAWIRADIEALPNGRYVAEDVQEDDGVGDQPYSIRVELTVSDDSLCFDYSGSDPQAAGALNAPYVVTASGTYNGLFQVIGSDAPINAGAVRPVDIIAPPGTVVNVRYPGACVGGQTEVQPRILDLVQGKLLSQLLPDRTAAACGGTSCNFLFGGIHPKTNRYYTHYNYEGIGWGGRAESDGNNAQIAPHGNGRNTPVEVFESRFPWIHHEYRLNPDGGGAGRCRGGLGVTRVMSVDADEITVSALCDRSKVAPWGLFGGDDGERLALLVRSDASNSFQTFSEAKGTHSDTKFSNVKLRRGETVVIRSPSGGGYGSPLERPPQLVADDVRNGYVTRPAAERQYGVVIGADGTVDFEATGRLRAERSQS